MAIENTRWPDIGSVPDGMSGWLERFYTLADTRGDVASREFSELFTDDGTMYGMAGKVQGTKAIFESRAHGWNAIERRKHEVEQVFTARQDYSNILIQGKITAKFRNGKEVVGGMTAQILFDDATSSNPKASLYKTWGDSAPWVNAMKGGAQL
ncbi:hypothetical protein B7463_g3163, partial [Scytalidium lignicola]